MSFLSVQIVRFVDSHQPGWVECEFLDARGRRHVIKEKVPVVTRRDLDADSDYPTQGSVACEILNRYRDENGQECVRLTTARPLGIETNEGLSEFTVTEGLVNSSPD